MEEEIRVVMFGKTGVGKSFLGNNILDEKVFYPKTGPKSVTKESKRGERMIDKDCKLVLVDTPGLFDTNTNDIMESAKILTSTVKETQPAEEKAAIEFLKDLFGSHVTDYLIIVFTGKDSIDFDDIDFDSYIDEADDDLKDIVRHSRGTFPINNRASREEVTRSVDDILKLIKAVYLQNEKKYYTDELLTEAQQEFEEKLRLLEEEAHKRERELEEEITKLEGEADRKEKQIKVANRNVKVLSLTTLGFATIAIGPALPKLAVAFAAL